MSNLNKVFLMGRLTRDPEQRFISSGQSVVNIGVAINRQFTTNGEKREESTFVDVEAWGPRGEVIQKYLTKGNPIFIEGRLKFDTWEKDGEKRSKLKVVLDNFQFIGGPAAQRESGQGQSESFDPSAFGIEAGGGGGGGSAGAGGGGQAASEDVPF